MRKRYKIDLNNVVWGTISKKTLLIPININFLSSKITIFELNGIGLEIWKMLLKNHNGQKIIQNLSKKYRLPKKQVHSDFIKFITQLKNKEIIHEAR